MISATLDVNILVSATIMPRGIPQQILVAWRAKQFQVVTSDHIITQAMLKLRSDRVGKRYGITTSDIRTLLDSLRYDALVVQVRPGDIQNITGDPEDDAVLATARLGRADFLVTGDEGLLACSPHEGVQIVRPRAFLDVISRQSGTP